jgi:hypothetical protein
MVKYIASVLKTVKFIRRKISYGNMEKEHRAVSYKPGYFFAWLFARAVRDNVAHNAYDAVGRYDDSVDTMRIPAALFYGAVRGRVGGQV